MSKEERTQRQPLGSTLDEMWSLHLMGMDDPDWDVVNEEDLEDPNHGWWTDED